MTTIVVPKKVPTVTVKGSAGVLSQAPIQSLTLVNQGAQQSLGNLSDVVPGPSGGVLVYDAETNKYKVQEINISGQTLNGGDF